MAGRPYEVFLSFRGLDTRHNFADFLYTSLSDVNIDVFRDDEELERGEEIDAQLIQAIEQSKISIPVFSKDYASSESCLMELEKMMECMDRNQQTIIPIFYCVEPSDVSNCSGTFKMEDDKHKRALSRIENLAGHHLVKTSDKSPTEIIRRIVREVELKLKKRDLIVPKQWVDVDPHVQEIMAKLKVDYRKGQIVPIGETREKLLIYGIPGVGKTVLAKFVYNKINHLYKACVPLEEIQKEIERGGVLSVQNRLISQLHKGNAPKFDLSDHAMTYIQSRCIDPKVLLLLDDVKDKRQLSSLVGDLDWLGQGSTVIVTSQRCDVLQEVKGEERFGLRTMEQDKALRLFCRHAFRTDSPPKHSQELSTKIVAAIDGLPLALQRTGEFLQNVKDQNLWNETLTALEQAPDENVREAFSKSYNTLQGIAKDIFLDIACFFSGKDKRIPYYMWKDRKSCPTVSIQSLCTMSFVEIRENEELYMQGMLKTFGQEIVKNENQIEPYERSRLWNHDEALDVLGRKRGTGKVLALGLKFPEESTEDKILESDGFHGLHNLRFLNLDKADVKSFGNHLSSLMWLDWQGCPTIIDVQSLNLNLQKLLILDLSQSQVEKDWRGWELLEQASKLKVLKLTGCIKLTATPNFPASMLLERLILEGCSNLAVIHPSLGNLTKLVSLNVKGCSLLRRLPDLGRMKDLKEVETDGTSIPRNNFQKGSKMVLETLSPRECKDMTYPI